MTNGILSVGLLLAAEPVLLILTVYLWSRKPSDQLRFLPFRRFVTLSALACLAEIVCTAFIKVHYSMPAVFYQSLYALNLYLGMLATCSLYLYITRFLTVPDRERQVLRFFRHIVLLLMLLLLILNFATGVVFRFNMIGRLRRGPLFQFATYYLPFYFLVLFFLLILIHRKQFSRSFLLATGAVTAFALVLYSVLMLFFPVVSAEYFLLALFAVVLFFLFETPPMNLLQETKEQLAEAYRQSEEATKTAMRAAHAKSDFLSNMSHEIRTPMNAIIGMNELILREESGDVIRGYASEIRSSGQHLMHLINDILDYSRMESGKAQIQESSYRLGELIAGLYEQALPLAAEKGILLTFDADRSLPDHLVGDGEKLSQAVMNLLSNAIKYTEQGSVRLTVNGLRRDSHLILFFKVADTGIGIGKEHLNTIFDSFSRVDIEHTRSILGGGLGLSITKELVNMMQGDISVRSEAGVGSVFTIRVPQRILAIGPGATLMMEAFPSAQEDDPKAQEAEAPLSFPTASVLIVDDNSVNLRVTSMLLKPYGIEADRVASGDACLKACAEKRYDLILLDHRMPEMDGEETLHALENLPGFDRKLTKIVCLTASDDPDLYARLHGLGFDDALSKPVELPALKRILRMYLKGGDAK